MSWVKIFQDLLTRLHQSDINQQKKLKLNALNVPIITMYKRI